MYSIVEYFYDSGENEGHKCGYCKKESSFTKGMWVHTLNTEDYDALLNRGWRRSGKYCYKPTMEKTCCPQYEIRCDVTKYKPSKSQKKVLKKMDKYLRSDDGSEMTKWLAHCKKRNESTTAEQQPSTSSSNNLMDDDELPPLVAGDDDGSPVPNKKSNITKDPTETDPIPPTSSSTLPTTTPNNNTDAKCSSPPQSSNNSSAIAEKKNPKKGEGADPNRPMRKKAKFYRMEKNKKKKGTTGEAMEGDQHQTPTNSTTSQPPTPNNNSDDGITHLIPHMNPLMVKHHQKHQLKMRLVKSNPPSEEFEQSREESFQLYKKYQMAIHDDTEDECTEKQWKRFLVDSPLNSDGSYGSYHNQYWLDGSLVAVGVIDVLPTMVSSVYVYFNPDYGFLSLGVYTAITEICLTRQLMKDLPHLNYYCLGFYIQSCPKMRYKGAYSPSELLCPVSYAWVPLPKCQPVLEEKKYSRLDILLDDGKELTDTDGVIESIDMTRCLHQNSIKPYWRYKVSSNNYDPEESVETDAKITEYAQLVGNACSRRILFYLE